jgi:hypothetical protein
MTTDSYSSYSSLRGLRQAFRGSLFLRNARVTVTLLMGSKQKKWLVTDLLESTSYFVTRKSYGID